MWYFRAPRMKRYPRLWFLTTALGDCCLSKLHRLLDKYVSFGIRNWWTAFFISFTVKYRNLCVLQNISFSRGQRLSTEYCNLRVTILYNMIGLKWEIMLEKNSPSHSVSTPASYSGGLGSFLGLETAVLSKVSRGCSQSLHLNSRRVSAQFCPLPHTS